MKTEMTNLQKIILFLAGHTLLMNKEAQDAFTESIAVLEKESEKEENFYEYQSLVAYTPAVLIPQGVIMPDQILTGVTLPSGIIPAEKQGIESKALVASPYKFKYISLSEFSHRDLAEKIYFPTKEEALYCLIWLWKIDSTTKFYLGNQCTYIPFFEESQELTKRYGWWMLETVNLPQEKQTQKIHLDFENHTYISLNHDVCLLFNRKIQPF
jgi:hypothetical protein